eukprot:2035838-Rhodomonas_salina.2
MVLQENMDTSSFLNLFDGPTGDSTRPVTTTSPSKRIGKVAKTAIENGEDLADEELWGEEQYTEQFNVEGLLSRPK